MRILERNKTTIYYANPTGKTENIDLNGNYTGEYTLIYGTPIKVSGVLRTPLGSAMYGAYGNGTRYDRSFIVDDMNCAISINSRLWIDRSTTQQPSNYICVAVKKSYDHIKYELKEVDAT